MNELTQKCLVYLRVSTDKQAEKGIAIPTQQEKCLECVSSHNMFFDAETDIYIDRGESARTMDRPALIDMLNRCKVDKSIKAIVVYDVSRLARNREDFAFIKMDLRKLGIKLLSATEGIDESPEGQVLEGILSTIAEFSSAQSARRIKFNMLRKAKDGLFPGKAPYGYKNVQERMTTGKTRAWIEVNWLEAKWVIKAYEEYSTGYYSLQSLAVKLQADGFPVRKDRGSGRLHSSAVEDILKNKFYIGTICWTGIEIPNAKHELFLDKALFEKVQSIISSRISTSSRDRRLFSVLKKISYCEECGSKITAEEHTTSKGRVIQYLRCIKAQKNRRVACKQGYEHESVYLEQFENILKKIQIPDRMVQKIKDKIRVIFNDEQKVYEKARVAILDKIEEVQRKRKNLTLNFIDKDNQNPSDINLYNEIKNELNNDEIRLTNDLAKAQSKISQTVRTVEIAISLTSSCFEAFKTAKDPHLKALLAQTLIKQIFIKDRQIVRVILNEPLDYLLRDKIDQHPEFDLRTFCGLEEIRTPDLSLAKRLLYQLSYEPICAYFVKIEMKSGAEAFSGLG